MSRDGPTPEPSHGKGGPKGKGQKGRVDLRTAVGDWRERWVGAPLFPAPFLLKLSSVRTVQYLVEGCWVCSARYTVQYIRHVRQPLF